MTTQPEALRLADELEFHGRYGYETEEQSARRRVHRNTKASAELRRQHERIKELEAENKRLEEIIDTDSDLLDAQERIAELEQALDVALEALETDEWMKKMAASKLLREVRREG